MSNRVFGVLVVLAVLAPAPMVHAQDAAQRRGGAAEAEAVPRPIRPADYGKWERLAAASLSPDGRWLAYNITRVEGQGELRIQLIDSDSQIVVRAGTRPTFSDDGRWLAFMGERRQLGLLDLRSGERINVDEVASFTFSDDSRFLAIRRGASPAPAGERSAAQTEERGATAQAAPRVRGSDLVIRDLRDGSEVNFGNVAEFGWQPGEAVVALLIDAPSAGGNGIRLWDTQSETLRTLHASPARYSGLQWRADHADLVVFMEREDEAYEEATQVIHLWTGIGSRRMRHYVLDPGEFRGFPEDTRIVSFRAPRWSGDGRILFVGLREWTAKPGEQPAAEPGDTAAAPRPAQPTGRAGAAGAAGAQRGQTERVEAPGLEIWHARDIDLIPAQRRAGDRSRSSHLAAWHLEDGRIVRLADDDLENVSIAADGKRAIGRDGNPYDAERMFGPVYQDIYLVDVRTGERDLVKQRVESFQGVSPDGRYMLFFEGEHFWTYDIERHQHVNITANVPARFVDDADDRTVEQKRSFGTAGWTRNDRDVLIHDRYDIWRVRADGSGGENLTRAGESEIRHRLVRLDREEDFIDLSKPHYLSLAGEWTKRTGYALLRPGRSPEPLLFEDRRVRGLQKAADADVYSVTMEAWNESPNVFITGPDLSQPRRVTDTNSFKSDYLWGRAQLIDYQNTWGVRLQGALVYPADYEPGRLYPMIVYPYERRSNTLHGYTTPSERSPYNTAIWSAEGYFVLAPDIAYRPRNPGLSAMEALIPAVQAALATGMIDPERVGLIGHSWGGYQTTFAMTQTDIFAAGVAGAPLTNMVSMYLSMYWNTGGTDARIFEISQGRMQVPWWEDYESYVANSPVHHIQRMNTPLLMCFGTEDGAVEFNQGIEFYNAARRVGKDFVLLVYEGENHSLSRRPNQMDYQRRILEWFGHYLKGEPAPKWITEPVPFTEQQEKLRLGPAAGRGR